MQIQGINILYPNVENMIVVLITKKMEIITSIQVCLISWMNFHYKENDGKKSLVFLQIESISIMYPNEENMIVAHITKRMEIVTSI